MENKIYKSFVQSLNLDTFNVYYWSFNNYQTLYNNIKQGIIDSFTYNHELKKYKNEDSEYFTKNKEFFRNSDITNDSTVNADVKLFVGANRAKKEIILMVDENNNGRFYDDRIIKITAENFKKIFDTLQFNVSSFSACLAIA